MALLLRAGRALEWWRPRLTTASFARWTVREPPPCRWHDEFIRSSKHLGPEHRSPPRADSRRTLLARTPAAAG